MITQLDGTKLLSHDELYKIIDTIKQSVWVRLSSEEMKRDAENVFRKRFEIPDNTPLLECGFSAEGLLSRFSPATSFVLEKGDWDIILSATWTAPRAYFIEYKSSIAEWKKEVHNFIKQITNRKMNAWDIPSQRDTPNAFIKQKVLMSFDAQFIEYESILTNQGIKLLILPQELLKQNG